MACVSSNPYPLRTLRILWLSGLLLFAAGCAPGLASKGTRPDPASVGKILLRITPDDLEGPATSLDPEPLAERVAANLRTWGYDVVAEGEANDYSHIMEARVGKIAHKSTPTGFSFDFGNSDPRALEFQKADVLPVDCVLRSAKHPGERASMYMDFVAAGILKDPSRVRTDPAVADIYVNHMGTVCFNLLDDLKLPRRKPAETAQGSPAWIPEVRIEVREKPVAGPSPAAVPSSHRAPPAPARVPASAPAPSEPAATEPETAEAPTVQTETRTGEGRKQIIIHNQGAPVILEFGYERK
jgi:hypothetical protein